MYELINAQTNPERRDHGLAAVGLSHTGPSPRANVKEIHRQSGGWVEGLPP